MNEITTLACGAVLGTGAGLALAPLTRRELALSFARSTSATSEPMTDTDTDEASAPRMSASEVLTLSSISGLLLAVVTYRAGISLVVLPPLVLLVGMVQLAYCDLRRQLLPKSLVHALSATLVGTGILVAAATGDWHRFVVATVGGLIAFGFLFAINLVNPRWMAFGDVRLSLAFGFGLAWIGPLALFQGFFYANILAVVVSVALMAVQRVDRNHSLPFGVFMALGAAAVVLLWA